MHLKSLTLRGFKSFASSTTLSFEPGITCVVGPNGSGKSNVVDAIAWVLGEQGAKSLRGGKMEDVIFAGTSGRAPLGRAEVILTIDNSDGALPIDYTEVTISRIMFRNGGSEYAINGTPCRLLDVQELLSDSGIGREMHVIVGQGQLDAVLHAAPEDRRAFIEEAAGVLKHRKRKEKALRKLEAMQVNLNRLQDLTAELRRQLKPLGQQAEVARRAAVVQADLRDSRLRLLADDLGAMRGTLEAEVADETALLTRRADVERNLTAGKDREAELEAAVAAETPRLSRAQETWYRLAGLRERFRGTASLAVERQRSAAEIEEHVASGGRDPEALEAEAVEVRRQCEATTATLAGDRDSLTVASEERQRLEALLATAEADLAATQRAIADRREGLARLHGQVAALRTRASAADDEIGRLTVALDGARERAGVAQSEFATVESEVAGLDAGEVDLDSRFETAAAALSEAEERLAALQDEEREVERQRAAAAARRDALAMGLARRDGSGALLDATDRLPGLLGTVAEVVRVESGWEAAVAAALGAAADAVAVTSLADAAAALELLRREEGGRAGIVVGGGGYPDGPSGSAGHGDTAWPSLPRGRYAIDVVTAPEPLRPALVSLLDRVALVDTLDDARTLVEAVPEIRAVTAAGDLLGSTWACGGAGDAPSLLEVRAALEDAEKTSAELAHRGDRLRFALSAAADDARHAQDEVDDALGGLHESDARLAAVAERLGQLGAAARAAAAEAERLQRAVHEAMAARDRDLEGLAELEERLAAAQTAPTDSDPDPTERNERAAQVAGARAAEVDARLAVRTGEERSHALAARAQELETAAVAERQARERAARARERRAREAVVAAAVHAVALEALRRLEGSLERAAAERSAAEEARTVLEGELLSVRSRVRELAGELEALTGAVHRDEVARAEQRLRIEALEDRAAEEFGIDPITLLAEYGPDVPVPPVTVGSSAPEDAASTEAAPYVREQQEKRLRSAERALALLGRINPLALEEFAALEERHKFLAEQLEDLKASRRDLLTVIKEVDDRVEQIFALAYADVAREFEQVFSVLFPGGSGQLVLTDPDDLLTSGIEVEARPPGKKVKRLSLLSGGERSLTAVAFLVAIFRARPSPFYVLDEVEAALDDRNLSRLVDLLADLKATSQLLIITHQKRTMEVADSLYGVSMRGDGITQVISQRLREPEPA
ncbi:MAG TPA: chromosome segregation protein SMC [Mycobacteriales bacterium]|nr:chromosome segregation protein SMC [Mycobacteriales bacterium]